MKLRRRDRNRRGSTMVETAFVLLALFTLVFGTLDLSIALFRQQIVSHAARQGARSASVHGSLAPSGWKGGPWGPTTYGPVAASSTTTDPKVLAITPYLGGLSLSDVQIKYEWLDNKNTAESRVKVTVSTTHTPLARFIFGSSSRGLSGSSTMPIAH
jgi:Flp pilus assembly protein TadG